jgi:hypothetical protein
VRGLSRWGVWLAVLALHVAIRLRPAAVVFGADERRPLLAGADSFYHAHRTRLLFESAPRLVHHDPYMFYPEGAIAQWSLGFDHLSASVLRLLTPSWEVAVWWLPFATPLLSLMALGCFALLVEHELGERVAPWWTGGLALNLAFVRVSSLAEYDHHVVETLCVILLLAVPRVLASGTRALRGALGLLLAWSIWNSTLLAFVVALYFVLHALALQLALVPRQRLCGIFVACLLLPLLGFVSLEAGARHEFLSVATLSLVHFALVALSLLGLALAPLLSPRRFWALALLGTLLVPLLSPEATRFVIGYIAGSDAVLGHVNETRPLFADADGFTLLHAHAFFGPALVLLPWALWRIARSPRLGSAALQAVFTAVLVVLALYQKRFAHLAVPGVVLVLGLAAAHGAWVARARRGWLVAVCLLLLEPAVAFYPETAHAVPDSARLSMRIARVLRTASADRPWRGVSSPPNFGSAINYAADLPSVTNAFFYPAYLRGDLTLRQLETMPALLQHMRDQKLGYLVVVDDARYRTMLLRALGQPQAATQAALWERTPCTGGLLRYAWDRLACGLERPPELEPLYHTEPSTSAKRLWRKLTVYRLRE